MIRKTYTVENIIKTIPITKNKVQRKDYKNTGKLPIVDQGSQLIGGYTDCMDKKIKCELPVIVFGDHSKIFKFIDFDFAAGADGIKVFRPTNVIKPKLLYYFLTQVTLPEKGYSRYFKYLKKWKLKIPSNTNNTYDKLIQIFDKSNDLKESRLKMVELLNQLIISSYKKIFEDSKNGMVFEKTTLGKLKAEFAMGGTPDPQNEDFYNGKIDWINGSFIKEEFLYESKIKISQKALDDSNSKIYPAGTVVVGRTGQGKTRGQTAILRKPIATNETMIAIYPIKKLLPEYLHSNLKSRYNELRSFGGDDRRGGITQKDLKKLEIGIPPISIQKNFAKIFQKYEELKLNLKRMQNSGLDFESLHNMLIKQTMS